MSLKFYFAPNTTAMTTSSVLDELEHGQSSPLAERIELSTSAGDTRTADYLKINPNGKVPAIVHDGIAIWESAAITIYLAELYGEARDGYSLADTHLSVLPRYLKARSFGLDAYPNVKAWEERVADRPALKAK